MFYEQETAHPKGESAVAKLRVSTVVITVLFLLLTTLYQENTAAASGLFWMMDSGEVIDFSALRGCTVILHTNDIHGRAEYEKGGSIGITAVATLKEKCIKAGADVILLDAGDTVRGTRMSNFDEGNTIVSLMNAAGYDAMVSGNHDYEYGAAHLTELSHQMNFPILGANVIRKSDNKRYFENHLLLKRNGVTYGIFGLTTKATMTINKEENVDEIEIIDPVICAKMEAAYLKSAGADIIVALCHLGSKESEAESSMDVLRQVPEINLLIDGHSHTSFAGCKAVNPSETTLYVSTGCHLKAVGAVVIDRNQNMTAYEFGEPELMKMGIELDSLEETESTPYIQNIVRLLQEARLQLPEELSMVIGDSIVTMSFLPTVKKELIFKSNPSMAEEIPVTFLMTKQISREYVYLQMFLQNVK